MMIFSDNEWCFFRIFRKSNPQGTTFLVDIYKKIWSLMGSMRSSYNHDQVSSMSPPSLQIKFPRNRSPLSSLKHEISLANNCTTNHYNAFLGAFVAGTIMESFGCWMKEDHRKDCSEKLQLILVFLLLYILYFNDWIPLFFKENATYLTDNLPQIS